MAGLQSTTAALHYTQVDILSSRVNIPDTACDLGVTVDSKLSAHVAALSRSIFEKSLTMELTRTFISCRLDYYNLLLFGPYGIFGVCIQFKMLLRASSQALDGELHWLPIRQSLRFQIVGFVYQMLTGETAIWCSLHLNEIFAQQTSEHLSSQG